MDEHKALLVQKQVKDNTADLQSEFLDMKNWEQQMRRKDEELSKISKGEEILPPIRNKKKKPIIKGETKHKEQEKKPKRIKSHDYTSWEKFDVDKACEEVDKQDDSDGSVEEGVTKEQLEKDHAEATVHKEQGNVFVKDQKWEKAIASYSAAIKIFPYDAVFFANRALCHLKMDNLYSAEADCTAALQLDEEYVKAFHRRATARMGLKQYKEAKQDIERILKLEPSNKEAKSLISQLNKKIDAMQPVILSGNDGKGDISLEKRIADKMFASTKGAEKNVNIEIGTEINKVDVKQENVRDSRIPEWLLEKDNVSVVEPITKPAHLRSTKPMSKISVIEVDFNTTKFDELLAKKAAAKDMPGDIAKDVANTKEAKKEKNGEEIIGKPIEEIPQKCTPQTKIDSIQTIELPDVPKTAVQFMMDWRRNQSLDFRYGYLKQIPSSYLSKVFQESMEADIFGEILSVLQSEYVKRHDRVFQVLVDLSVVKRFRALIMFMSNAEKQTLKDLFDYCEHSEAVPKEAINKLRDKYEV